MDADRFDTLSRSLSLAPSRRGAFRLLVGSAFGGLFTLGAGDAAAHDALKKCKKKSGKQKKKCLKKARKHNATHATPCTPNCSGKACGDDGCGGSCGDCFRGSCQGGVCLCATGEEVCDGACVATCEHFEARDPDTCDCCGANFSPCGIGSHCCSGNCHLSNGCEGRNGLVECTFGAQCRSGVCQAGKCTCDGDICDGTCRVPCGAPHATRNPITCACCVRNGFACFGGGCACCCSGTCDGPTGEPKPCTGLPDGAECDFAAQCASGTCEPTCSVDNLCTLDTFCQPA